jgi:hypothetical protein
MSATYERVKNISREEWLFNRAELILESKDEKGPIPPPLNVIQSLLNDLPKLVKWAFGELRKILRQLRVPESAMKFTEGAVASVAGAANQFADAATSSVATNKKGSAASQFREGFKLVPPSSQMLRDLRKKEQIALKHFLEYEESLSSETLQTFKRELNGRLNAIEEQNRIRFDQLVGFVLRQTDKE